MCFERFPTILTKLFMLSQMSIFFMLNRYKFQILEFKSLMIKPLQIDGCRYIILRKGALVKNYSSLYALKVNKYEPVLEIGPGCSLGHFNHIAAVKKVVFGKNVLTANNVYISDNLHEFRDINLPIMHQPVRFKAEVNIGDGSWIGENACVIGANVGKNCVVGANSVVTRDIPDYSVAIGAPAQITKRFSQSRKTWEKVK